jgi:hypothetical protein
MSQIQINRILADQRNERRSKLTNGFAKSARTSILTAKLNVSAVDSTIDLFTKLITDTRIQKLKRVLELILGVAANV